MAISRCRIRKKDQLRLVELFVAQATARTAADLVAIHRNSAALYFHKLRQCIAAQMAEVEPEMAVFECDESYFGGARKGKRGRGAAGKVCVFGILKRDGKVYALPVADTRSQTLLTALKTRVLAHSVVYTDHLASYNILDVSGFKHRRVNHRKEFVTRRGNHINGIENFWNQSKRILRKYNGIPRKNFFLFLKECEFRFNYGTPRQQLNTLRDWVGL
ncbi:IS1595 family transposase [Lysobacter sp. CA196]|uniref:IS1595 family transposase n=1 Tax=Lysobacter sp. CA196 TaxID=3455606 RepID=UPI003F8D7A68